MSRAARLLRAPLVALLAVASAAAPAAADVTVDVALAHGGRWIQECVTPVSVTLRNDGREPVAVRLSLSKARMLGSPPVRHERAVFLGPGATRREWFMVPAPDAYAASLALTVSSDPQVPVHNGGDTATRGLMTIDVQGPQPLADAALPAAARIVAVLGDDRNVLPSLLPSASRKSLIDLSGDLALVAAMAVDPESLVLAPFALEGFDALVLIDPGPDMLSDPVALSGVLDWVAMGGLLVVSPGPSSATLGGSPLGPYLPARTGAPRTRDLAPLVAQLAVAADPVPERDPSRRDGTWLPLADAADGALFVDRPFGSGTIRLLAFDVRAALRACTDVAHYAALAEVLAGRTEPVRDEDLAEVIGQFRFGTGTDVEGAVLEVLRRDAFQPPPLIVILAALVLYVLVVGPIDWIVLRRLGRQRLTTFTFGGAVLLFTVVAYGASFLVFASGAVVNRLVFVDLADSAREGRPLVRVQDLVGYYSPRGADRTLSYSLPAVVEGASLPGGSTSEVGSAQPLIASGADALSPQVTLQVAFRSQRVVRTVIAGTTGRTIETEWLPPDDAGRARLRIVNGLPVDLDRVDVLLPGGSAGYWFGSVPAGGEATASRSFDRSSALGSRWAAGGQSLDRRFEASDVANFLGFLSRTSAHGFDGAPLREDVAQPVGLDRQVLLARTGIGRGDALFRGHALLLASARESPLPLPASEVDGRTHVIIRKEFELP